MMLNKQIYALTGVTENDYRKWCRDNKKKMTDPNVKRFFFERIQDGRLVKDQSTGKIISKRRTNK